MTIVQFKQLPVDDQAQVTWDKGVHLSTIFNGVHAILLWQIEDFYVEFFYNRLDNHVDAIRSFRSTARLRPYLKQIDLDSMLH